MTTSFRERAANAYVTYQQAYLDHQRSIWTLLDGLAMIIESPKVRERGALGAGVALRSVE